MAKSASNETELPSVESSKSAMIDSCIKEFVTLKEAAEKSDKKVRYYTSQVSKLLESNRNIETNYEKLMLKISEIDAKILQNTRVRALKRQELKDLRGARTHTLNKQWDDCQSEIGNYADDFSQWITEYSREVLMKDVENYRDDCKKVGDELAVLQQELNDMKREYDSDYIEANMDINDLSNLNTVMPDIKSNNNNLTHAVRSTEDTLNKIQSKIKQSKVAVNESKTKEKTNMF